MPAALKYRGPAPSHTPMPPPPPVLPAADALPLFRPLERRPRYRSGRPPKMVRAERPHFAASRLRAARRVLSWCALLVRTLLLVGWDRLRGRRRLEDVGRRLRAAFERAGGTFIKIGQDRKSVV